VTYKIVITPLALKMLGDISDRRVREKIRDSIDSLGEEPEKKGKPLTGDLAGYLSRRAVGQRYRIIYRVEKDKVLVLVIAIGIRKEGNKKDIYALARKLLRLRLLEPPQNDV
jgi:mRNA interferase RelE/StbE